MTSLSGAHFRPKQALPTPPRKTIRCASHTDAAMSSAASLSGSSAGTPPSTRADSNMITQWRARNAAQRKRISLVIENNLELQMLVLSTIENYESARGSQRQPVWRCRR